MGYKSVQDRMRLVPQRVVVENADLFVVGQIMSLMNMEEYFFLLTIELMIRQFSNKSAL